jgi:transcriptional regulator with XRE-family HTH domain
VAANLKAARAANAPMTQSDLATMIGVDPMFVSKWERGVNRPSEPNLMALADALGVEPAWFFTLHGDDAQDVAA